MLQQIYFQFSEGSICQDGSVEILMFSVGPSVQKLFHFYDFYNFLLQNVY